MLKVKSITYLYFLPPNQKKIIFYWQIIILIPKYVIVSQWLLNMSKLQIQLKYLI
jgi:hypothetical protein